MFSRNILRVFPGIIILLLVFSGCSNKEERASEKGIIKVSTEDEDMNKAIDTARSTLSTFWQKYDNPQNGETDFVLKLKITDKEEVEHFWVSNIEKKDGKIYGVIANEPEFVESVKFGQVIEIKEKDISDWSYMYNDKIYGNYTLRAMFKSMPKEQVDKLKPMMAE